MDIKVLALGAGQDVGRSCVLVKIAGKTVMFDAGMHAGYDDHRRFPDFDMISRSRDLTAHIDCVIISHFHLDHCGALPFFSEVRGYFGPILMTYPTKSICPVLLEDYRKITVEKLGGIIPPGTFFTSDDIRNCLAKVTPMRIGESITINDIKVTPYYAGHVLGAAMFLIQVGHQSALYTGDYNMTPDRHLGAASVPCLRPDVLITESTYANTIRDSKRLRERQILQQIYDCVLQGGKVLIPVFALGRAQELMLLIEMYWERMQLAVPVYVSQGLSAKATQYYKLYVSWTSENIKKTFLNKNMFDFKYIKPIQRSFIHQEGAMVVFATPGMLHSGQSLEVFKHWSSDPKNLVILPGYCVAGTVGNKILSGQKTVQIDPETTVEVNCGVSKVPFSAHADAKGIIQLVRQVRPRHVVLVHGERSKMSILAQKIESDLGLKCHFPAIGTTVVIEAGGNIPAFLSETVFQNALKNNGIVDGYVCFNSDSKLQVLSSSETIRHLQLPEHVLEFTADIHIKTISPKAFLTEIAAAAERYLPDAKFVLITVKDGSSIELRTRTISIRESDQPEMLLVCWTLPDDLLATSIRALIACSLSS